VAGFSSVSSGNLSFSLSLGTGVVMPTNLVATAPSSNQVDLT
jgi:hypothetical protein